MADNKKGVEVGQLDTQPTGKLEKEIQREICEWLELHGYFFWRSNNIPVYGKNNAGKYTYRSMGKYTPLGIPDIFVLSNGDFIGLEVKRDKAPLRPEQVQFGLKMYANGAYYRRVTSVDEVVNVMKDVRSYSSIY